MAVTATFGEGAGKEGGGLTSLSFLVAAQLSISNRMKYNFNLKIDLNLMSIN
jgi:hypothetical protein